MTATINDTGPTTGVARCGHPWNDENMRFDAGSRRWRCKTCCRERSRRYAAKKPKRMTRQEQRLLFPFHAIEKWLHTTSPAELAERTGLHPRHVLRLQAADGGLTEAEADQVACTLGLTPSLVPGWDWEAGAEYIDITMGDPDAAGEQQTLFDLTAGAEQLAS